MPERATQRPALLPEIGAAAMEPGSQRGPAFGDGRLGNGTSKATVFGVAALLLAASAVATAEPGAVQCRGGPGWQGGGWGSRGAMAHDAPEAPAVAPGAGAPYLSDPYWSDSCWQVRPIYSISGAWLDNRRVNVCY